MVYYSTQLYHHGVEGQKWGKRRYQYEDGSYKPGAEGRYYDDVDGEKGPSKKEKKPLTDSQKRKRKLAIVGAAGLGAGAVAAISRKVSEKATISYTKKAINALSSFDKAETLDDPRIMKGESFLSSALKTKKLADISGSISKGAKIASGILSAGYAAMKIKDFIHKKQEKKKRQQAKQAKQDKANQASED